MWYQERYFLKAQKYPFTAYFAYLAYAAYIARIAYMCGVVIAYRAYAAASLHHGIEPATASGGCGKSGLKGQGLCYVY